MLRSKGVIVQKHYVTDVTWAAQLKRIIAGRLRYPQDRRLHQDGQNSFLSFFYFVHNFDTKKKLIPNMKRWYDVPLTDEEIMVGVRCGFVSIRIGPSLNPLSKNPLVDTIEVYAQKRNKDHHANMGMLVCSFV